MKLFLADYPRDSTIKEGMSQRILAIDSFFESEKRVYLNILLFGNFSKKKVVIDRNVTLYRYNAFIHIFQIFVYFMKASSVYIHSVYNVLPSLLFIVLFSKHYILDIHGVVPEENKLVGRTVRSKVYDFCEYIVLHKQDITAIVVTNSMKYHYKKKFPKNKAKFIGYIIFPNNLKTDKLVLENTDQSVVNIVYSGNVQKWQNIDLMAKIIASQIDKTNYKFYILTGELENMKSILSQSIPDIKRIDIQTLPPSELDAIYTKCHYGFVLRDDILVNNVACPTKVIEYMYYGITPIVLNDKIGDFKEYDYESVKFDELDDLVPSKSYRNIEIIERMKAINQEVCIRDL